MCDCDYVIQDGGSKYEPHYDNCSSTNKEPVKNPDGTIKLPNPNLQEMDTDILYHINFNNKDYDLPAMFGDVKFVCMGGTEHRMRELAKYIAAEVYQQDIPLVNLTESSKRYAMFKVGSVLCVNHGIGIPSMTTVLQEVIKLMYYAKAKDPIFLRIGTSGGLDIPAGSVVVSSWGLNGTLEKHYELPILGKIRKIPSFPDKRLVQEIASVALPSDKFKTYIGGTMGADDFYRGQARLDGPFCDHTEAEKMEFLTKLSKMGVRNIEMEAPAFTAFTREAGVRAGIICVTFLDRLFGDQVTISPEDYKEYEKRPLVIVGRFIKKYFES